MGMRLLIAIYRYGGGFLFRLCLAPVVAYYYLSNKRVRQHSKQYIDKLNGFSRRIIVKNSALNRYRHLWNFASALLDKIAIWSNNNPLEQVDIHHSELITRQLEKKQGAILLVSHVGNFEISKALSSRHESIKINVILHTQNAEKFNRILDSHQSRRHIEFIQVTHITPATAMVLSEKVDAGEFIVIAGDRTPPNNQSASVSVPFLGQSAYVPLGPYMLADILQVPIITMSCFKYQQRHIIEFYKLTDKVDCSRKERQATYQNLANHYAKQLEKQCQHYPLQWFNFFDFWQPHD